MKVEELMIGDLVYYSYPNQFVTRIIDVCSHGEEHFIRCQRDPKDKLYVPGKFEDFHVDILSPIPLTDEFLRKNGFEYYHSNCAALSSEDNFDINQVQWPDEDGIAVWEYGIIQIRFVHEFQHLLKLCGIEKEIVL